MDELQKDHPNRWVAIDVAAAALEVTKNRAYQIARRDKWRKAVGSYPKQYHWGDILDSHQRRKGTK